MIEALIDKLIDLKIDIELLEADQLKIHTDINSIPGDLLTEIRLNKDGLVKFLLARNAADNFDRIPLVMGEESYPLSSNQRRLWILSQFQESNIAYNIPGAHIFEGQLDCAALEHAFNRLTERHESLRTVFRHDGKGLIRQFILPPDTSGKKISFTNLTEESDPEVAAQQLVQSFFTTPFNLADGPLIRAGLLKVATNKWIFAYVMHHIISDGWSMQILIRELLLFYNNYLRDISESLAPLRIQYKDYAAWQQQQLNGASGNEHKAWWLKQFEGTIPVLELPSGKIRPAIRNYNAAAVIRKHIPATPANALLNICQEAGATLFMGILAAVNGLFYRYTHQEDIIIGTPIAGREHIDLEDQIGFYVNTLALRTQFSGAHSFRQLLDNVKQVTLGAYKHQSYPFDELVDLLNLHRDESRHPLFDVQVTVKNAEQSGKNGNKLPGKLAVSKYSGAANTGSVFDMVWNFMETSDGLHATIVYNSDVFDKKTVTQLADHLEQWINAIVAFPDTAMKQLELLNESEQHQLLVDFNKTELTFDEQKNILHLFREQVAQSPNQAAVVYGNTTLSYRQLDERSNQLAHYLLETYQVRPDEMIGVLLDRSAFTIISLLAILKAGGAYMPINPELPHARRAYLINDTAIRVLISEAKYMLDLDYYLHQLFAIDLQLDALEQPIDPPTVAIHPRQLAYVIYTSGSTGDPKGVMIEHASLALSIQSQRRIFNIEKGARSMQFCSSSFDVSIFEIFITLASGAALYIIPEEEKKDALLLEQFMDSNRIEVSSMPPAYLKLLPIGKLRSLRKLITGGEPAMVEKVNEFCKQGTYYNAYGPTESSLCTAVFEISKGRSIDKKNVPVGRPIPYTQVYILNDQHGLLPVGVAGELYIGGSGLARGYLNNPVLTAEKFIDNPFRVGERMYRTGDMARWLADGTIEFIGRKDDQVKIHGNRVELGEIEKALQMIEGITASLVIAKPNAQGVMELVAYLVCNAEPDAATLRTALGKQLPAYMLPDHFVELPAFPLTPNGKINKNQLPAPEGRALLGGVAYQPPVTGTEEKLVKIWEAVLGKEKVGIGHDYFELGGNSLKAMIVVKQVVDETGLTLPIKVLFEQRTIQRIASYLDHTGSLAAPATTVPIAAATQLNYPASYNQRSYFSNWNKNGDQLVVLSYDFEQIDITAFQLAINLLIERHEILRTVFVEEAGSIRQMILLPEAMPVDIISPVTITTAHEMQEILTYEYSRGINLFKGPLFLVKLYQLETGGFKVLLTMHHIITDAYSGGVLKADLAKLYYESLEKIPTALQPLPFQYRDFANWQQFFVSSDEGVRHRNYWVQKLAGVDPSLQLTTITEPTDADSIAMIARASFIDDKLFEETDRFARTQGLTRTGLLMGVLALALHQASGQQDITICTTVSGRDSPYFGTLDVSSLIGFFANLLLVRNAINTETPVTEFLQQVQRSFLDDLGHGSYPFEKLIHELPAIDPDTFLQAAVYFNYHNYDYNKDTHYEISTVPAEEIKTAGNVTNLGFVLAVTEYKNCLRLQFLFNGKLFPYNTRKAISENFRQILERVLHNSSQSVHVITAQV